MKLYVSIVVRKAEPYPGGYSVSYGPDTFTYCNNFTTDSYANLRAELERVGRLLALDSRLRNWPGLEVSAENKSPRKPNGWNAHKADRVFRAALEFVGGAA